MPEIKDAHDTPKHVSHIDGSTETSVVVPTATLPSGSCFYQFVRSWVLLLVIKENSTKIPRELQENVLKKIKKNSLPYIGVPSTTTQQTTTADISYIAALCFRLGDMLNPPKEHEHCCALTRRSSAGLHIYSINKTRHHLK